MKVLVINGPNLNMLGIREPDIYGKQTFKDLEAFIKKSADELGISVSLFQSNHEGAIVDEIQAAYGVYDGIVINPAAYTHTSVAILDALGAVAIPTVEVHISDMSMREKFRQFSYVSLVAKKTICGKGFYGIRVHEAALEYGVKVTGATVHFVNEIPDGGKIILQKSVYIKKDETPESLQQRVMRQAEWQILPRAAEIVAKQLKANK